jgi:hypothetical protein
MLLAVNWEQRLLEMILAGGALVAAACSPSSPSPRAAVNTVNDPCSCEDVDAAACAAAGGTCVTDLCLNNFGPQSCGAGAVCCLVNATIPDAGADASTDASAAGADASTDASADASDGADSATE